MRAHAKLNLGLRVLGRRADGFHEIATTMVALDLHDRLEVEVRAGGDDDAVERLAGGDPLVDRLEVPTDGRNLVLRAAAAYREAAIAAGETGPPPLRFRLWKRIPVAAGLGGGSSDAAAVLGELARRWPAGVDLRVLAARLGSDVPFFVAGSPAAAATGRGERLAGTEVRRFAAVLVNPGVPISAADAYGWWDAAAPTEPRAATAWGAADLANDLEAGVRRRVPEVDAALELLTASGAPSAMTGSGATCYALFGEAAEAAAALGALRGERPSWWWAVAEGGSVAPTPPAGPPPRRHRG